MIFNVNTRNTIKMFYAGEGVPEKHIINFFALVVLVQPDFGIYFHIKKQYIYNKYYDILLGRRLTRELMYSRNFKVLPAI